MNIIDRSALSIAQKIHRTYPEGASEAVLKYSLSLIINTLSAVTLVLLIGLLTGHTLEALIVIISYTTLRYFSGGIHLSSSLSCCLFSIITFTLLSHLEFYYNVIGIYLNIISIIILFFTAPKGIEKVSSVDPKYYPVLKIVSMIIVGSNFFFQSSLLAGVFFTQAVLTTNIAFKFVELLERRWIQYEKNDR
jgi:accessory gene regulator B